MKVSGSDVLNLIKGIDMSEGYPKGMKLDAREKLYSAQYMSIMLVGGVKAYDQEARPSGQAKNRETDFLVQKIKKFKIEG